MKMRPLSDRVVIRPRAASNRTVGGLHLPDQSKERTQTGEVLAVGPGRMLDSGALAPMNCRVGDVVFYNRHGASEDGRDDDRILILGEHDILAILEQ